MNRRLRNKLNKRIRDTIFWRQYTPKQRAEIRLSIKESFNPDNWVSHEEVMAKYSKYFKKPKESDGWSDLTVEQQMKLDAAITQTYDPANLVSKEDAFKMMDKWLTE